jgi:hypothetical protein
MEMTGALLDTGDDLMKVMSVRSELAAPLHPTLSSLSFCGCAWLFTYHLGVGAALTRSCDFTGTKFLGASSGAIAAVALASGVDMLAGLELALSLVKDARRRWLGPVGKMTRYVSQGLMRILPDDAFQKVDQRVICSVTRLPTFKNELLPLSGLTDNRQLVQRVLASCYIPLYYEKPIFIGRKAYLDGGATNNMPRLNGSTVTVSPTPSLQSSRVDIGPLIEPAFRYALFPKTSVLRDLYQKGEEDGMKYLDGRAALMALASHEDLQTRLAFNVG